MQKYYVKNVGNYGFTGAYNIDKETQNLQIVYLDDLYKALGNGDGEDVTIYLAKFMAPYEGAIKDKYPKATIENNEKFDAHTKLHDWFPGAQPLKAILKDEVK